MEILGLHHTSIMVSDLDKAREFYCDILGLEPLPRPNRGVKGMWLAAGTAQVHVIVGEVDGVPLTARRKELEGRGLAQHFALRVADTRAAAKYMFEHGYGPLGDEVHRPDGSISVFCRDLDGNLVEFIQTGSEETES